MTSSQLVLFANHLWQSSLFVAWVWLLTLVLRGNRAALRHSLWFAASVKFLIPFTLLVGIGSQLSSVAPASPRVPLLVNAITQPFGESGTVATSTLPSANPVPSSLFAVWLFGFVASLLWWAARWFQLRRTVRLATTLNWNVPIRVLAHKDRLEPGVFGIIKPVLLLPEGVTDRLSQAELQTVIAHELCHVQRRDNLTASIHMLVEAVFWFHPLVWWIKFRLIDEQERACDEAVLRGGGDPKTYAESILKICECYLTSPSMCVSGITSSNLRKRIEAIMRNRVGLELSSSRKLLLVGAAIAVLAAPFLVGIANAKASEGRPEPTTTTLMPSPQGGQRGGASVPQGFVVGEIRVIGAKVISDDFVRQTLGLVPGETYDESRLGKGFGNLTRFYGAAGYVNFLPQPTFQLDEQRRVVNLTINIDEGVRYFVARIGFAGNTSASDDVLRRELSLKEGLPFNAALMEPAIARLNQLGLFEEIRIEDFMVAPYPNEPKVDVFLKVTDKKR